MKLFQFIVLVVCRAHDAAVWLRTRALGATVRCCAWCARVSNYYSRAPYQIGKFTLKTPKNDALNAVWLARAFYLATADPTCTDLCNWLELFGVRATRARLQCGGAEIELDLIEKKHADGCELAFDSVAIDDLLAHAPHSADDGCATETVL